MVEADPQFMSYPVLRSRHSARVPPWEVRIGSSSDLGPKPPYAIKSFVALLLSMNYFLSLELYFLF